MTKTKKPAIRAVKPKGDRPSWKDIIRVSSPMSNLDSAEVSQGRIATHPEESQNGVSRADSPPASVLQKGSISLGTDPRTNAPVLSPVDSASKPRVQVKGLSEQTLVNYLSEIGRRIDRFNPSDDEYRRLLLELLSHQDLRSHVNDLQEPELRGFIELLDNVSNAVGASNVTDFPGLGAQQPPSH